MKKIALWIIAAVLIVGASVAIFMFASSEDKVEELKPIEDPVFLYVNLAQLAQKGAFDKFITPENRALVATALSSQLESVEQAEHLKNIVNDIDAVGIDTQTPIYGYINDDLTNGVIVAKLADVTLLDRSVELLSYIIKQSGKDAIDVLMDGDIRTFEYENIVAAYNKTTLAITLGEGNGDLNFAIEALNRPQVDMSVFGASDMAALINTGKCVQLANEKINEAMLELNQRYSAGEIDEAVFNIQNNELTNQSELILSYASHLAPNSNIVLSTTFDLGRMTLAYNSQGITFGEYAGVCKETNMEHLSNLSKNSYAIMSIGIDGNILANFVRTILNGEMLQSVGITPTNEVNMFISIACDALSTINGGVTLALEEVDGQIKQQYNYYWDEYSVEPAIKNIKAMLMADVSDTYIISNIAQFAGGFLNRVDATHYTLRLLNYNFSMGQDENLFHLGVNMSPGIQSPSALEAEWSKDVEGAIGYMVVNVDTLMSGGFIKSANDYISSQILKEYRSLYNDATEAVSYICLSADSLESAEMVVVFDNKSVNALEQINSIVLPVLIREGIKSLF